MDDFEVVIHHVDTDDDGVSDNLDNCNQIPNGPGDVCDQDDTDTDGYGTACDADLTNDGASDFDDVSLFGTAFGEQADSADFNCDGTVDFQDISFFEDALALGAPGPSGFACAGTVPCP